MSTHGNEPEYGQRLPPQHVPPRPAPSAARAPAASARAARRMARGLSFTLVLLGLLIGGGLTALGQAWGWAVGALLALPGLAGFVVVQTQLHPALRDASVPPLRSRSKLWLIPAVLLLLGLLPLAAVFAVQPLLAGTAGAHLADEYVSVLVVSGMTLVVAAALGFGLVAMASFTPADDDDSPLRPTGYAERLRRPARGPADHYDSEWIHRRPARYGRDAGDHPGPGGTPPEDLTGR
ncbi:hypothetical protein [Kocuria sp. NPDC057446]|uniref:hypothetical protein n=1 Tax=Kocuria sp. NPDC057446 TaxID=3346137 RepID=UPI0036778AAF